MKIIVILGPTASNKSKLGEYLLKLIPSSLIVNFDAFQFYKEMDIGTAKPSKEELNTNRYLFYDYLKIDDLKGMDIYRYQKEGRELINKYLKEDNEKTLIFIGGSGLYIKALLFNYIFKEDNLNLSSLNSDNNKDYSFLFKDLSNKEIYDRLIKYDKEDTLKININNRKRLERSLYLNTYLNISKSKMNKDQKDTLLYLNTLFIYLKPNREELYLKINQRVDKMFDLSLKDEALNLIDKYGKNKRALQAIGYKEWFNYDKDIDNIEEIKELIKKNTRNYAKRQLTFFNHQFNSVHLNIFDDVNQAINNINPLIDNLKDIEILNK